MNTDTKKMSSISSVFIRGHLRLKNLVPAVGRAERFVVVRWEKRLKTVTTKKDAQ